MKKAIDVIVMAVGFLFAAVLVFLMVNYFNRGKAVATKNADSALALIESTGTEAIDVEEYNGETVSGSIALSMIEALPTMENDLRILAYTSGGDIVAEYTKAGATPKESIDLTKSPYLNTTPAVVTKEKATGSYKDKTDATYINPTQNYKVVCHYTANKVLAYVSITHVN